MRENQRTAPIAEDYPDAIRVPVVHGLRVMPYFPADQAYQFHADNCPQCSGDSCFPCEIGGALGEGFWTAVQKQHYLARQN